MATYFWYEIYLITGISRFLFIAYNSHASEELLYAVLNWFVFNIVFFKKCPLGYRISK